jgi:protein-tyrosine phosphatase
MDRILTMLLDRGLIPIMTHPERHTHLGEIPPEFLEWIRMGCLVQITAQSLLGRFGRQARESAWNMMRRSLVHFVASDAHDTTDRPPRLDTAFEAISKRIGQPHAEHLCIRNPQAVIRGEAIAVDIPKPKPWYRWGG